MRGLCIFEVDIRFFKQFTQSNLFILGNPDGYPIHSPNNYDIRFFNELSDEFWTETSN